MPKLILKLKDNFQVRTLEELRQNFNLQNIVSYFKDGLLQKWLEERYYDEEAEKIAAVDKNDADLVQKICLALNVECNEDLDFSHRLKEKKSVLAELTEDEEIIDNAAKIALNQEDLANLIDIAEPVIYLCGESFNVPVRMTGRKYIGILSTPKIKIKADSQEELDAKNISFENCRLPFIKTLPLEELKALFKKIYGRDGSWEVVGENLSIISSYDKLDKVEKSLALRMICQGRYTENQIVYLRVTDNLDAGFALTIDSFCTGGAIGTNIINYSDIKNNVEIGYYSNDSGKIQIPLKDRQYYNSYDIPNNNKDAYQKLFGKNYNNKEVDKLARFLNVARTL